MTLRRSPPPNARRGGEFDSRSERLVGYSGEGTSGPVYVITFGADPNGLQ